QGPDAGDQPDHTSMISASLRLSRSSILCTWSSVSFCTAPSARRSSSSPTCPDRTSSSRCRITSRRTFRTATRPSSAYCFVSLTSSLRRSSVSCGIGRRISLPSFEGWRPRSDSMIVFSIVLICDGSKGWIVSMRGSGTLIVASCFSGIGWPYASTTMRSRSAADARPVRTELKCSWVDSTDLSIRRVASWMNSSMLAMGLGSSGGRDDRADPLAGEDAADVAGLEAEDIDRQLVVHAQRERGRVHHLEAALDRLEVRQAGQELRVLVDARVAVVDPAHLVLRHQDRLGADLQGAERGRGVGREERVAGTGGEDHDAALLEVPDGAAANVRLGDLGDGDRREHARLGVSPLERVLHGERVQDARDHAGRGALHAADDVPAADDDRELDACPVDVRDLVGERVDPLLVDPEVLVAG